MRVLISLGTSAYDAAVGFPKDGRVTIYTLHLIKIGLVGAAALLAVFSWFADRTNRKALRRVADGVLILLVVISVCAYFDFGYFPKFGRFMNPHDTFHYYLGSKYSREVGYFNLYRAVVIADSENHGKHKRPDVRNMEDYSFSSVESIIHDADKYKAPFTEDRWKQFRKDTAYFEQLLGKSRWGTVVDDMGYNATPVWNMVGRFLTNRVSTGSPFGMGFLVSIDLVLIAAMILVVWRAFGWRTALWTLIFFCTCYCMAYTHIRGGFMRLDWVCMLVMAVCMLKLGRYKTAGVLVGYAGMSRVFPLVFAFGVGVKFMWAIYGAWKLNPQAVLRHRIKELALAPQMRKYIGFFLVLGVVCGALMTMSIVDDGGLSHWREFSKKIAVHNGHIAPPRVGFKKVFLMNYNYPAGGMPGLKQTMTDRKVLWWAIQGTILLVSIFLLRNVEDYESICYGYVPAYFLTTPTFYYHVMLVVALFLFLPKRALPSRTVGMVLMFLISIAVLMLNRTMDFSFLLAFILSLILLGLVVYIMVVSGLARPVLDSGKALAPAPVPNRATQKNLPPTTSGKSKPGPSRRRRRR